MCTADSEDNEKKKGFLEIYRNVAYISLQLFSFFTIFVVLIVSLHRNNFVLTKEVLFLIIFLLVIAIGTSYDKISLVKIFSFEKAIKEERKKADEYKDRYDKIANEFSLVLRLSQKQIVNNYNKNENNTNNSLESAGKDEKAEIEKSDIASEADIISEVDIPNKEEKKINYSKEEEKIWDLYKKKFCEVNFCNVQNDVKISSTNSISRASTIFDRYYKINNIEYFVEMKLLRSIGFYSHIREDIGKKLNLLIQRKNEYGTEVKLHYVLAYSMDMKNAGMISFINRLNSDFSPSLASGILKIEPMEVPNI